MPNFAAAIFRGSGPALLENPIFLWFFRGVRTWIRTCNFTIFWYLQCATKTQTSLRKCAFSIQHWWLRNVKLHRFYVEWINFVSNNSNHNLEKRPFCIQVCISKLLSKFTQLFNAVVCMFFFKVTTSAVTCKVQFWRPGSVWPVTYIYRSLVWPKFFNIDVRFLSVIVTPNPCPRHVCLMPVTIYWQRKSMLMTVS